MSELVRQLDRLLARADRLGDPEGSSRDEVAAASQRLGRHIRRMLNAHFFGLPQPTPAEIEQAIQDRALVAAWDRRHGIEPEPLSPMDRARITQAIEERIRLGEPWPTD